MLCLRLKIEDLFRFGTESKFVHVQIVLRFILNVAHFIHFLHQHDILLDTVSVFARRKKVFVAL